MNDIKIIEQEIMEINKPIKIGNTRYYEIKYLEMISNELENIEEDILLSFFFIGEKITYEWMNDEFSVVKNSDGTFKVFGLYKEMQEYFPNYNPDTGIGSKEDVQEFLRSLPLFYDEYKDTLQIKSGKFHGQVMFSILE